MILVTILDYNELYLKKTHKKNLNNFITMD